MPKNKRPRKRRVVAKTADPISGRPDAGQPTQQKPVPQKTYGVPKSRRSSISPVMNRTSPRGR